MLAKFNTQAPQPQRLRTRRSTSPSHTIVPSCRETPSLHRQPEPTAWSTDSTDVANLAHRSFVLGVILGAVEGAGGAGLAGVDGGVRGAADVEFAEGVELDVDGVVGGALACGFDFAGLRR